MGVVVGNRIRDGCSGSGGGESEEERAFHGGSYHRVRG